MLDLLIPFPGLPKPITMTYGTFAVLKNERNLPKVPGSQNKDIAFRISTVVVVSTLSSRISILPDLFLCLLAQSYRRHEAPSRAHL